MLRTLEHLISKYCTGMAFFMFVFTVSAIAAIHARWNDLPVDPNTFLEMLICVVGMEICHRLPDKEGE